MSDDTEDRERVKSGKKGKDKEPEPDKSTPFVEDEGLALWIERKFRNSESVHFIVVTQLLGRGKARGEVVLREPIVGRPDKEKCVVIANEIYDEMQNEANALRQVRWFAVEALNPQKGAGVIGCRTVEVSPKGLALRAGAGASADGVDDDDQHAFGGDILRKRVATVLADGQWHSEHVSATLGGVSQILVEENRELRKMVNDLFAENMRISREKNVAENNALDRELARDEARFRIDLKKKGVGMVSGLLASLGTRGKSVSDGGGVVESQRALPARPPEVVVLDGVVKSLSEEEEEAVFGAWSKDGACQKVGLLTQEQTRLVVGLVRGDLGPEHVDRLFEGPDAIAGQQYADIAAVVDVEKLMPLLKVVRDRNERAERARAKAAADKTDASDKPAAGG